MGFVKTLYVHDYRERMVAAQLPAGKCVIVDASHPSEVTVNEEASWYVVGEVRDGYVHNPAVALWYRDGPADSITVTDRLGNRYPLARGEAAWLAVKGDAAPGARVDSRNFYRGAIYPQAGTYTIWLVSGYITDEELAMGLSVNVTMARGITRRFAMLSWAPLTFIVGGPIDVALSLLWWAGALSPLIAVGGVVGYSEALKLMAKGR